MDKYSDEANLKSYPKDMSEYRKLPIRKASNGLYGHSPLPELDDLMGASVLDVGFHPSCQEGGLTIDYRKDGKDRRIVIGYTELGTWVEWQGDIK